MTIHRQSWCRIRGTSKHWNWGATLVLSGKQMSCTSWRLWKVDRYPSGWDHRFPHDRTILHGQKLAIAIHSKFMRDSWRFASLIDLGWNWEQRERCGFLIIVKLWESIDGESPSGARMTSFCGIPQLTAFIFWLIGDHGQRIRHFSNLSQSKRSELQLLCQAI
jgi:hypothetical protein